MSKGLGSSIRLLLSGGLLFGTAFNGCVADALRDAADGIDDRQTTLSDVGSVMEDWVKDLW